MLLVFNSKEEDQLLPLRNSIKDGQMGNLSVDPTSLKVIKDEKGNE
jgi:hypothetical protein